MLIGNLSVFINCDLEKCNCGSVFSHVCDRMGFFSPTLFFSNPIPVCLVKQSKSEPVSMMILRKLVNVNGEKSSCYVFLGKKKPLKIALASKSWALRRPTQQIPVGNWEELVSR